MQKRHILVLVVLLVLFIISPFFHFFKSILVMSVSSAYENKHSVLRDENISINMPGGLITEKKDWYPFVMTFNASEPFSKYIGRDVELSILYNFGAFNYLDGSSLFYDAGSDYYTAFYGAYVVKDSKGIFGYGKDGLPNYEEMFSVPEYDMRYLVLQSLGCTDPIFKLDGQVDVTEGALFGYDDWHFIEGRVITQSPMHEQIERKLAYIQYGAPPTIVEGIEAFPLIKMHAKLYARYFEEKQCSIFFYILAPKAYTIDEWEKDILSKTELLIGD